MRPSDRLGAMSGVQPIVLSTTHGKVPPVMLVRTPTATETFWYDAREPVPEALVALDQHRGGGMALRKRIGSARLLRAQSGTWILRRSVFEPELQHLDGAEPRLVPVAVHDAAGLIDDDWVLLHVETLVAVDRDASTYAPSGEAEGTGRRPTRLAWSDPPRAALFRLGEHPWVYCAAPALYARLHRASKRVVVEATPPYEACPAFSAVPF